MYESLLFLTAAHHNKCGVQSAAYYLLTYEWLKNRSFVGEGFII